MQTININRPLTDLTGKELPDANMGKVLGNWFAQKTDGNAVKQLVWAMDLFNKGEISVDDSDYDSIIQSLESTNSLTVLAKGQILKALKDAKKS